MKMYEVTITETLQRTILIRAECQEEAEEAIEDTWKEERYVLNADDFVGVKFEAKEHVRENREKSYER